MTRSIVVPTYTVQPTSECRGGLILVHEVWGLSDHIHDVAERFGREGYLVVAPDLLTGTDIEKVATAELQRDLFSPDELIRSAAQPKLRQIFTPLSAPEFAPKTISSLKNCFETLYQNPIVKQRVGIVGYCFGGTYSFGLAVAEPRLKAVVPYYGSADGYSNEELANIKCPILAFYGEKDERLISQLPELKQKMQAARVNFSTQVYPDCGHAFFSDTNPHTYNEAAARDAWRRTLEFLATNLSK